MLIYIDINPWVSKDKWTTVIHVAHVWLMHGHHSRECLTIFAACRISCLAGSRQMAGTVTTHWTSRRRNSMPLWSLSCCSACVAKNSNTCAKTVRAGNCFPLRAVTGVSLLSSCKESHSISWLTLDFFLRPKTCYMLSWIFSCAMPARAFYWHALFSQFKNKTKQNIFMLERNIFSTY